MRQPERVAEWEGDKETERERERQTGSAAEWHTKRQNSGACQVDRHYWALHTQHQAARAADDKNGMAQAKQAWLDLRRQAIWQALSPSCFAGCLRAVCLPRSL